MNPFRNFFASLRRYKAASALNIAGLSVAFASFMIIMTQVRYDLGFDSHYKNKERIFRLENQSMTENGQYSSATSRGVADKILAASPEIEQKGLISGWESNFVYDLQAGKQSRTSYYTTYKAEAGVLDVLEFEYLWGNAEQFTEPNTVLISQEVSKALYGAENPVGRMLVIGDDAEHPLKIIGVYKNFPKNSSLRSESVVRFIGDENLGNSNNWNYHYFVRLNRPQSAAKVLQDIRPAMQEIWPDISDEEEKTFFRLSPITQLHYLDDVLFDTIEKSNRITVYSLLAIAVLIIVIAIINFVNLSVSLVPVRIRSINTRKVLGSTDASIRFGMIGEAVGTAVLAFLLSLAIVELFASSRFASLISEATFVGSDRLILFGSAFLAIVTGIVSGIYPAFYSTSFQPALVLKGSFGLSPKGRRLRTLLISVQYIVSIALIVVAIAIHLQNRYMQRFDMGFERENILGCWTGNKIGNQRDAFADRLKTNPAIADVTFSAGPLVANGRMRWGRDYNGKEISYDAFPVEVNFLSFMGIGISEGRDFLESDALRPNFSHIFNETARRQDSIAVGSRINDMEVVGIARDFNFRPLQFGMAPFAFLCFGPHNEWYALSYCYIKVHTADIPAAIDFFNKTVKEFDPDVEPDLKFMDDAIGQLYLKERNLSTLIALFSLLSVLISVMGVFGLILFETQYRRKEIGVRKVFGATTGEILRLFNRGFVRTLLLCFVIAAPAAWFIIRRWQENFAYKAPLPVWIFLIALLAVLAVTVLTISLQSYRTATENPVNTVRSGE